MSILFDLQNGNGFTDAEKTIASYLLEHTDELQDLAIGDLAEKTNTSNASVIRLCRKLGTKGYRDFRISLLREVERIPEDSAELDVSNPIYDKSSPTIVMKNISDLQKYALNVCYTSVSAIDLQKAAFLFSHAKRILLYGLGESDLVARIFARRMARIGYFPVIINEFTESLALAQHATDEDVAVFISYSGAGISLYLSRGEIRELRNHGCKTIAITSNKKLSGFDQLVVYPHYEDENENIATFYSTTASNYILSVIYSILFARDYQKLKKEKDSDDSVLRSRVHKI